VNKVLGESSLFCGNFNTEISAKFLTIFLLKFDFGEIKQRNNLLKQRNNLRKQRKNLIKQRNKKTKRS
jgi:FtsZ-binding cell division protein ZapB